jgi:hypothetical protein
MDRGRRGEVSGYCYISSTTNPTFGVNSTVCDIVVPRWRVSTILRYKSLPFTAYLARDDNAIFFGDIVKLHNPP